MIHGASNWPFRCLNSEIISPLAIIEFLPCCGFHSEIVTYLFHINYIVSCIKVLETYWQRYDNSSVLDTAWERDHFSLLTRGLNRPSGRSLRKWSFFVTNRGSQQTYRTQLEKVIIFRYWWGVPTDPQDTAWESDHFSLMTGVPTDHLKSQCNLTITFKYTSTQTGGGRVI